MSVYTCWCGAKGTYEELFEDSGLERTCGGSGTVHCRCGGDLCVCHNHGETDCLGCPDCRDLDDPDFDDYEEPPVAALPKQQENP